MKQKLSFFILLSFVALMPLTLSAQLKGFSFGPYFEAAWVKGDFALNNNNGIGVGVAADLKIGGKTNLMGSLGYLRFGRKSENGSSVLTAIPLRVGLKYRLPLVYLKLESGSAKMNGAHGTALIISPGIGFRILGLDVQGSYETWLAEEGRSFAALKIAYHF
ncbi:MAG: outer membrane beta-barrel protein [Flavisolibacter sp.]